MRRALAVLVLASLALIPSTDRLAAQAPPVRGFDALFDLTTGIVRDANGDGLADAIAARIIVPDAPSAEDVLVATNLAGRLGFETSAMTLPVVLRAGDAAAASTPLPILVGKTNPRVLELAQRGVIDLKSLEKGQGLLAIVAPFGVVVAGADDAGTVAAGNVLAAYLPRLWGATGARLDHVQDELKKYLAAHGVRASSASVTSLVVDSDRRGIKTMRVTMPIAALDMPRAKATLDALDAAHRGGLEPTMLNFANIATTVVDLLPPTGATVSATIRRSGLNTRALTPPDDDPTPAAAGAAAGAATPPVAAATTAVFDLSSLFSIDGVLGDSYPDLIADRVDTTMVFGSSSENFSAANIAARLGLESTGMSLPIARKADDIADMSRETNPMLIGRDNPHVSALVKIGRAQLDDLKAGEGVVQIVPRAFGNATATVVAGADAAGADAAAMYLSRRVPYLWDNSRSAFSLEHLQAQVSNVFAMKTGGAQASAAVNVADEIAKTLAGKEVESFDTKVFLEERNPAFEQFLTSRMKGRMPLTTVTSSSEAITASAPVFDEKLSFPWEVTEFRDKFKADVLPKVTRGSIVSMDIRLSESPELRRQLADETRQALIAAGAASADVKVRSAYKQGFLWMSEEVLPALKGKNVASIHVKVAEHKPDFTKKYKFYQVPTRWLHELYPIDELMAKQLAIPVSAYSMELVDSPKQTYEVEAKDRAGKVVFHDTFSPKSVEREYLDKFPGWSKVDVTTGWLNAVVNGTAVIDTRIQTDSERFWDYYQSKVLPRIYDHVMKLTNNRPTTDAQPFHRDLDIELWMSEPDFRIGVDEEQVSALESLHEDLYFVTLDFYLAMGRNAPGRPRLSAPGKIFPIIHPERRGQAGEVRVLYAANAASRARVEITYKEKGVEKPTKVTRDLTAIPVGDPAVRRAVVTADHVRELQVDLSPTSDADATRAVDVLDTLSVLHGAGLYQTELSYAKVDRLAFSVGLRDARTRRVVAATGQQPASLIRKADTAPKPGLINWDHVIGPDEADDLVKQLGAYPAIRAYKAGQSYRGREVDVMEVTLPTTSEQVSVTKYTAYKPTIFITGRQHANEVSSTSHILKLAEMLATDPKYAAMLKRINVVLHPVENPDGAAMAFELQKLTPTHMLHAGRYSALGQDVGGASPLLPESQVRNQIWRQWLPDIYLNPHGYPSHEWVQQFAGYVPPGFRAYLSSRGWYTQLTGLRDPRYTDISTATDALRDSIAGALTRDPQIKALNLQHQDRYRRWAFGFAPFVYNQEIYEDTAIYYTDPETGEPRGGRRAPAARASTPLDRQTMAQWPQVTFNSGMTEAPDETAQGVWLGLVTQMGFNFLTAHLQFLNDGQSPRELIEEGAARDGVTRTWVRIRPVAPKAKAPTR